MYGYIYETTNIINGRKYIGRHKSNKFDPSYKGSGKILREAFCKYGKENFVTKIIDWCDTEDSLNDREIYWIAQCNAVNDPNYYNIARGGYGRAGVHFNQSEYQKQRASDTHKNKRISQTQIDRFKATIQSRTPEERVALHKKCSEAHLGKPNSNKGKKLSDSTRKRMSESHKGKHPNNYGAHLSEEQLEKHRNKTRGRIHITNGDTNKFVRSDELDYYFSLGFHRGRTINKK